MSKEPTLRDRMATVETILAERLRVNIERRDEDKEWRKELGGKIDKILSNSKEHVTSKAVAEAIALHAENCPAKNPGSCLPSAKELTSEYWKLIVSLVGIIGTLGGALAFVLSKIT